MKKKIRNFFVILGIMFLCSMVLLGILSAVVWHMDGAGNILCAGIIMIYIFVNAVGGFLVGKTIGQQKFFWGVLIGASYFLILALAGFCLEGTEILGNMRLISGGMICIISGMLGGMLAPGTKEA